jgi:hypothetical protein
MENTGKIGIAVEKHRVLIDRRLSVAPMMDGVNSWRFTFVTQLLSNPAK